ncbi:MAG: MFS transporter [Deltaproteobacteria bacterium]|jgi:OPA family glycerol-3-phosphate transporter-like MFS transporter|nr:MFS transporter [Deltaproteobacteria bacterium]MBW2537577.1 MFS transporter [Deltaproteobacteria bacterium]
MPAWLEEFSAIAILLVVVGLVLWRLPKVEIQHSQAYRRRRFMNWFPLGLTYAFLYMGRYNLTVSKNYFADLGLMTNEDFGTIFFWGALTYGFAFIINGPLCDRVGGRKTILLAAAGSCVMNMAMGAVVVFGFTSNLVVIYSVLYSLNMYFQAFGAVSIVKVNAQWFHVRERGVLGGIFGILISLGIYFAFDWNKMIARYSSVEYVFIVPAVVLAAFFIIDYFLVRDTPSHAGFEDIDTADASEGDDGPALGVVGVVKKMVTNPIILTIAAIEFCSGFLRNAIMQWGNIFGKQTGIADTFVFAHWGMMLCCAGIMAGMFAGVISDYVFQSRRGPVASILYIGMLMGSVAMIFILDLNPALGLTIVFMSLCVIGVHGMLSGTASADFGGKKNAGVAVGLIDACVYLGTAAQSILLGRILPDGDAAKDPNNWGNWPIAMVPLAILGTVLALRIWNAKPKPKQAAAH